ncbi:MAG: NADH-ubiquinone oxidoreductase subunit 6 [Cyanobacteria bacterium RYN_339]|nr:NADH-ubiquinone oxidoreductase subunit 6 [Cyanobacteria bacterium RYN_339]
MATKDIAVIGGGAAGLAAAYLLSRKHRVLLFESADRLGGHAHTVTLQAGPDAGTALDVAFMVLNDRNYPTMHRLLDLLGGIAVKGSEMSFGYQSQDGRTQYALNLRPGYVPGPHRPPETPLLMEIVRFFRHGARDLDTGAIGEQTYGQYLRAKGCSQAFIDAYAIPMAAALWSSSPATVLEAPAAFVLAFYRHHGLLSLDTGPDWQTIAGGSQAYVSKVQAALGDSVVLDAPPVQVFRTAQGVELRSASGKVQPFDAVVVATPADRALALLGDPDEDEARLLGAWRYQASRGVLHSDERVMPTDRGAWASWNYVQERPHAKCEGPTLTYHLDRLQALAGLQRKYFLTLNPVREPGQIQAEFAFRHPVYDAAAIASQAPIKARNGARHTYFAGNYLGNGFHEDAISAGAAVAAALGCPL